MAGTEVMLRHDFEYTYKELANPCKDEPRNCLEECPEVRYGTSFDGHTHLTQEDAGEETLRITTRARQTYDIYSFNTNAMLIVSQEADRDDACGVIDRMKTTFERFRFEVEVYFASDPVDLYSKCQQFFGSDFRNHGAVALAIMTSMALNKPGNKGVYRQDQMSYKDAIIIENLQFGRNPTLQGKPKIYISMGDCPFGNDARAPAFTAETHSDVLAMQIPLRTHDMMGLEFGNPGMTNLMHKNKFRRGGPIDDLCDKIRDQGENVDMATIMKEVAEEYQSYDLKRRRHYRRIPVETTLDKQLYLVRTDYYNKCVLLLSFMMSIVVLAQLTQSRQ